MKDPTRVVPVQISHAVIKNPMHVLPDPQKTTSAIMYYSQIWKNGKLYNIEVLYDKANNTIMHFLYNRDALGPLSKVK